MSTHYNKNIHKFYKFLLYQDCIVLAIRHDCRAVVCTMYKETSTVKKFYNHFSHSYLAHLTLPSSLCISPKRAERKDVFPLPTRPTIIVNFPKIIHKIIVPIEMMSQKKTSVL